MICIVAASSNFFGQPYGFGDNYSGMKVEKEHFSKGEGGKSCSIGGAAFSELCSAEQPFVELVLGVQRTATAESEQSIYNDAFEKNRRIRRSSEFFLRAGIDWFELRGLGERI